MTALAPDLTTLLRAHGLDGAREHPLSGGGYTGAGISRIQRGDERYVVKRSRCAEDWVRRLTGDATCREAEFAVSPLVARLPASVRVATVGATHDGDAWALLMRDISPLLLPEERISNERLDAILAAVAAMHAAFWDDPLDGAGVGWCGIAERLSLLSPRTGEMLVAEGNDFGLAEGWRVFDRIAPPAARDLARRLRDDVTPLVRLIESLPPTLLHGDLKAANMGLEGDTLWLLDWTMVSRAPVALDISWLIAVNSGLLPPRLDDVFDAYARHLERALGRERIAAARWPEQRAGAMLCGLMMYGWGKALDAVAGYPEELRWWCEGALAAEHLLSA